jgi:hypothetical protein
VGRVVRREADLHAIAGDHADAEAPHPAGQLGRHGLAAVERDLVAAAAENLLDRAGRLDQIVSRQMRPSEAGAS